MTWNFLATRMNGDGTETLIANELPISGPEIDLVLNGHGGFKGTITPEIARLKDHRGDPIFVPWSTAIYAEASGLIRGGGILESDPDQGPALTLDCLGHSGYLAGTRYTGAQAIERGDPLATAWHLWEHTQARPGFNIGMTLTGAKTSRQMFLGDDNVTPSTTPQKVDPYVLAWWETHDLAKEFDALAELAPFEWTVHHRWDGDTIVHELATGYPRLGRRRDDLRFVVGENVTVQPQIDRDGEGYASDVFVIGAGEGRTMLHQEQSEPRRTRLGRDAVIVDKTITTPNAARARAAAELRARTGDEDITEISVADHPNARLGTYDVGDDILIETAPGWTSARELWVKILGISIRPDEPTTTLSVRRAEKVT